MRTPVIVLLLTTTASAADRYYSQFEWGKTTSGPAAAPVTFDPTVWELVAVLDGAQSMSVERLNASLDGRSPATPLLNFSTEGGFSLLEVPTELDLNPKTSTTWSSVPFLFRPSGTVVGDYQSIDFRNQFELELPYDQVLVVTSDHSFTESNFELDYSDYPNGVDGSVRFQRTGFILLTREPFDLEPGVPYEGVRWDSSSGQTRQAFRLTRTPPGDATNDGSVQFDDFVILAEYFGTNGVDWEQGDFDGDGQVQFPDFVLLANNFGTTPSSASTVPEPMPLLLLLVGVAVGVGALRRRVKREVASSLLAIPGLSGRLPRPLTVSSDAQHTATKEPGIT